VTAAELAQASTRATPAQLHPKAVHLVIFSIETENVRGYGKVEKDYLKTPDGRRPPTQIAAIIRYILRDLLPFKFKTKSNDRVPGQDTKKRGDGTSDILGRTSFGSQFAGPKSLINPMPTMRLWKM
jgi:hypothetical protein